MDKKKKRSVILICVCILAALTVVGAAVLSAARPGQSDNLARMRGVIATSDSAENEDLTADKAIDGDDEDRASRWSSKNDSESAAHYIELEFPKEISVSFVVLKWERRNVTSYALEGSLNGEDWGVLCTFDTAPVEKNQEIALDKAARVKYLRLCTYRVSDSEADYSNLYKNVSLYELEVYADKPAAYLLGEPSVGLDEDGGRYLVMPQAPDGYEVACLGADYEQVVGADGTIYPTIQEKEVTVGFRVTNAHDPSDTREVARTLTVPACGEMGEDTAAVDLAEAQERQYNGCPRVIPALAEWRGGQGELELAANGSLRVVVQEETELRQVAELFAGECGTLAPNGVRVEFGSLQDARAGDLYLGYADVAEGLGEEGYTCDINDMCVIKAETATGARWGMVTVLQLLAQSCAQSGTCALPRGQIRDYPLYAVRGFGIDVARKPVSMETLFAILEEMSYYKMNDLSIHLNDNVILSTSGLTDSPEEAMTADSAFRLESDVANEKGERLTSSDYAYTKEQFAQFVETAQSCYGVTVVPEIDTPAHALSVTKLYPDYALGGTPESVDQIDLDNEDAVALVREIWQEALVGGRAAFKGARIVNIGMDEYYGDGEQYRRYAGEIADLARAQGKTVRMWGSLSNMAGSTMPSPRRLQMNLWSTVWADPREMYEAGYSLINMQNNHLYVIPGGGYDHLDNEELYDNWEPNRFYDYDTLEIIPRYSAQMLGAAYMIWNDMAGRLDVGISEYDLYERFGEPLAVLSSKLWGETTAEYGVFVRQADETADALYGVRGRENLVCGDDLGIEPVYEVQIGVRLDEDAAGEQVIAESDGAYGEWAFYAATPENGKVGFAREGRLYEWDYALPCGEQIRLSVVGEQGRTTLYVNGASVGTLGSSEPFEEHATFVFPIGQIGELTGRFQGEITLFRWKSRSGTEHELINDSMQAVLTP